MRKKCWVVVAKTKLYSGTYHEVPNAASFESGTTIYVSEHRLYLMCVEIAVTVTIPSGQEGSGPTSDDEEDRGF